MTNLVAVCRFLRIVLLQQQFRGFDGRQAGLAEAPLAAVVEDDVGGAMMALILSDGADGARGDLFGADRLPVAGQDVPLDGRQAEFAGDAEDGRAARSVGWAEEADGRPEGVFENGVAVGEFAGGCGRRTATRARGGSECGCR